MLTVIRFAFLGIVLSGFGLVVLAQNELDVARYTQNGLVGTARSIGMGGAFSAVGSDFSAASLNPAGLGLYRKTELFISPTVLVNRSNNTFLDKTDPANAATFSLSGLGLVINGNTGRSGANKIKSYAIAFGYNQLDNYRQTIEVTNFNEKNSFSTWIANVANVNRLNPSDLLNNYNRNNFGASDYATMAYGLYLPLEQGGEFGVINHLVRNGRGYFQGIFQGGGIEQQLAQRNRGRLNEWTFAFGLNLDDRLYIGGTMGIVGLTYRMDRTILEIDTQDNYTENNASPAREISLTENLVSDGIGINGKVGVIYQPLDYLRFGASITTPTWYGVSERFNTTLALRGDNGGNMQVSPIDAQIFDYNLATPFSVNAGVMFMIEKFAIITGDYTFTNSPSAALFESSTNPAFNPNPATNFFSAVNLFIDRNFMNSHNVRLGAELKQGNFYVRGGYAFWTSLWNDNFRELNNLNRPNVKPVIQPDQNFALTGGLGVRSNDLYLDLAYVRMTRYQRMTLYNFNDNVISNPPTVNSAMAPVVGSQSVNNQVIVTFGVFID